MLLCVAELAWLRLGPLPPNLLDLTDTQSTVIVDRNGEVLYEARNDDGGRSTRLSSDRLPAALIDATVAAEDGRFWHHPGLDPIAIARATVHDLRRGRLAEGGSTITQQVAKLLLARQEERRGGATPPRSLTSKLQEAVVALRLEHRLTKREILALYVNLASYGNQLVGADRASREYFGISVESATPAQAAFLAALPQRPSTFNPYRSPSRAIARQQFIIRSMVLGGWLSVDTGTQALSERLQFRRQAPAFTAPHFVQRVREEIQLRRGIGYVGPDFNRVGTRSRIVTTLDAELQRDVEGIIRGHRSALERHGAHNVAVVVLDNATGEWLAWEGSGDYDNEAHGGAIDGASTPRQPGSALKPLTYALAFEKGESPATVLADVPSYFPTAEAGVLYSPRNYDGQFRGPLLARRALAGSENVPAVALASRIGVPDLLRFLRQAGLTTFEKNAAYYGLGLTLGDAEVRLDELVAAYAAFARGGERVTPTMIHFDGDPFDSLRSLRAGRIVSPRTAFWITDILTDADAREYAFGRGGSLDFPFAVAVKTGTSQAYRDNWTIGYTKAVTVGVWVGNFDRTPLVGSSGVTGAGPIFHAVMVAAVRRAAGRVPFDQDLPTTAQPELTERRRICALSGMTASPWCPTKIEEWAPAESPSIVCSWHHASEDGPIVDWPHEYRSWAQSRGLLTAGSGPIDKNQKVAVRRAIATSGIQVMTPPSGAIYLIDPTLRPEFQTVALRARSDAGGRIEWFVDDRLVGSSLADAPLDWTLAPGSHVISARDRFGRVSDAMIVVK